MKRTILTVVLATLCCGAMAQHEIGTTDEVTKPAEDEVFMLINVDEEPEFPGGIEAMYCYLASNIVYPDEAKAENIQGLVMVNFVIEKDGSVSNIKLLRDIGGGCGDEAVRVVQAMPRWKPGHQSGRRVRTSFNLPVNFKLD